jgi:hypothetical protein
LEIFSHEGNILYQLRDNCRFWSEKVDKECILSNSLFCFVFGIDASVRVSHFLTAVFAALCMFSTVFSMPFLISDIASRSRPRTRPIRLAVVNQIVTWLVYWQQAM